MQAGEGAADGIGLPSGGPPTGRGSDGSDADWFDEVEDEFVVAAQRRDDRAAGLDQLRASEAAERADAALTRFLPPQGPGVARQHHVTAIVLAHDGARWLPRTLAGLAGQRRSPDVTIGIDAGSADGSGQLLGAAATADRWVAVRTVPAEGIAAALDLAGVEVVGAAAASDGLAAGGAESEPSAAGGVPTDDALAVGAPDSTPITSWFWIVHDDSAPDPNCLEALLAGADRHPEAHVLIPKTVAWSDAGRLVGIGLRWSPGVAVVDRLDAGEHDQGQHDTERPVYTGNSAGMLVRADVWARLGGMDGRYAQWAAPLDLCRRVWGSGGEVWFVPEAVLAHRRAGGLGVRSRAGRPDPRREVRSGQLLLELTQAGAWALPWRGVRAGLTGLGRALALMVTREPEEATAELAGTADVLGHPGAVLRGRRALRRPPVTTTVRPSQTRARRGTVLGHWLDSWTAAYRRSPGDRRRLWPPRRVWLPLAFAGILAVLGLARAPQVLFGSGTLRGGGLLPGTGGGELLRSYLHGWQDVRFGVPSQQPAYLALVAVASVPLLGSVDLLLRVAFGLALPLAFLSAYLALGRTWVGWQRALVALAWALLPAGAAAMSGGRISTLAVLVLGPVAARLCADALSRARRRGSGIRPAIAAGTVLGITCAFAPTVFVIVAVLTLLAWLAAGLPRWPVRSGLVILLVAGLFLVLWALRVWSAPWLLLTDLGRNDPTLGVPAAGPWGLSPGGPSAVAWAGVPLVVVGAVAVALRGRTLPLLSGLVVALLLVAGVAWTPTLASSVWPQLDTRTLWPGQPLLVAGGILVLLLGWLVRDRRVGRALTAAWVGCVAVLAVGWWNAPVSMSVGSGAGIPSVVGLDEESPGQPRALVLSRDGSQLRYAVSTGPATPLGTADAVAAPRGDQAFAADVAALVSGAAGDVQGDLGGRGIRYVVFDGAQNDAVVADLDAVVGLRRLASTSDQTFWLVAGDPVRAQLVGPTDAVASVVVPVATVPTTVDVVLHPDIALPRTLLVAESFDPGWRAQLGDAGLALRSDARGMLLAAVGRAGPLQVGHRSRWSYLALGQLALLAGVAVLALPKRRRVDVDDPDRDQLDPDPDRDPHDPLATGAERVPSPREGTS